MIKKNFDRYAERIIMTTYLSMFFLLVLIFLIFLLKEKPWQVCLLYGTISLVLSAITSIFLIFKVEIKYLYFENIVYIYLYSFLFFLFLMIIFEAIVPIITELLNSKYLSKLFDIK